MYKASGSETWTVRKVAENALSVFDRKVNYAKVKLHVRGEYVKTSYSGNRIKVTERRLKRAGRFRREGGS